MVAVADEKTGCNPWKPVKIIKTALSVQPGFSRMRESLHSGPALSRD